MSAARCHVPPRPPTLRILAGVLVLLLRASAALAHSFEPALLDLREREAGVFDVVWKMPGLASGALMPGGGELAPRLPGHCRRIGFEGSRVQGFEGQRDQGIEGSRDQGTEGSRGQGIEYAGAPAEPTCWRVDCGAAGLRGARLAVDGLEGSRVEAIVQVAWRDGTTVSGVLRSGETDLVVPDEGVGGASMPTVLWSYLRLGIEHILSGVDHLFFVLALLLLVDTRTALLKTISAFTLAHSVTLALAILGVVAVPAAPVEASIALSIVLLAKELACPNAAPRHADTLTRRYPWVVAFAFGLLHGLGFAGALVKIGLPPDHIPLALLAFNGGVEVGQLAFVAAMIGPVALLARIRWPLARLIPAYAIGAVATAWVIQRVGGF